MRVLAIANAYGAKSGWQVGEVFTATWQSVQKQTEIMVIPAVDTWGLLDYYQAIGAQKNISTAAKALSSEKSLTHEGRRYAIDLVQDTQWLGTNQRSSSESNSIISAGNTEDASIVTSSSMPESSGRVLETGEVVALPLGDSFALGVEVKLALAAKAKQIHIHLPRFTNMTDMGVGFLNALVGSEFSFTVPPALHEFRNAVKEAQQLLQETEFILTATDMQPLLGLAGMAYSWTYRGVSRQIAQDIEKLNGEWHFLWETVLPAKPALLGDTGFKEFAGVAGGLGLVLTRLTGAMIRLIGDYVWNISQIETQITGDSSPDLICYIGESWEESVPKLLQLVLDKAEQVGVPVILLTSADFLRKGEAKSLGLAGVYDLQASDFNAALVRVAQTWAW